MGKQKNVETNGTVSLGPVIPDTSIPITQAREAFGRRSVRFGDISNYNWVVKPIIKMEPKKVYVPEVGGLVEAKVKRQPMTMFVCELKRLERDERGEMAPKSYGGAFPTPFYTFDNSFTAAGFEPRDVALAIWQMRKMWGSTIEVHQMTDAEVDDYYKARNPEEYLRARERVADPATFVEAE